MSERGSTGASSRKTTLPSASWRSFPPIEKLTSASMARQAISAIALRIDRCLFWHDHVQQKPPRGKQYHAARREHASFCQQRCVQQVVVARHVIEQRRNAEAGQQPVAVRKADDSDHQAAGDTGRLEGCRAERRYNGEVKDASRLLHRPSRWP